MRARVAVAVLVALTACAGPVAAPEPSSTPSSSASPSPSYAPKATVQGIGAALRRAGSADISAEIAVGTARPSYSGGFTVLFADGSVRGGFNPVNRVHDRQAFQIRRTPGGLLVADPPWRSPPPGPPWERYDPRSRLAVDVDSFVRRLALPGCAGRLRWTRVTDIPADRRSHMAGFVTVDVYEGDVTVADCVPFPPGLLDERPARAQLAVHLREDGLPVLYTATFGTETLTVALSEFGAVDAFQPIPAAEIR